MTPATVRRIWQRAKLARIDADLNAGPSGNHGTAWVHANRRFKRVDDWTRRYFRYAGSTAKPGLTRSIDLYLKENTK